ncbi:uncharacterized protein C7orf26 isoform X2 [Harpegnathos saltator]|nr:uncharacterized protein C7orf26 isoform X2 [Harpegnathos saltator]
MDLISEFVFGELDKRKRLKMSWATEELQLVQILSEFFQGSGGSPAVRNALFLSLFPADNPRYETLGNLVSLAITTERKAVLNATGIWMQQLGSTSPQSVGLARHLLDDYLVLTPCSIERLKQLSVLVPHFTANLLTAIGEVYEDKNPPVELLQLVGEWIDKNPDLLLIPLMDNPALPTGGIPMTPITPIAGLLRWCILSPLRSNMSETFSDDRVHTQTTRQREPQILYSKLQQLLMDSMSRLKNSGSNKHAISAQHLASTTRLLAMNVSGQWRKLAIERLAQALSMAMMADCIYGNKQELLAHLQSLSDSHGLIEWVWETYASRDNVLRQTY